MTKQRRSSRSSTAARVAQAVGSTDKALDMKRTARFDRWANQRSRPEASLDIALNFTGPMLTKRQTRDERDANAQVVRMQMQGVGEAATTMQRQATQTQRTLEVVSK